MHGSGSGNANLGPLLFGWGLGGALGYGSAWFDLGQLVLSFSRDVVSGICFLLYDGNFENQTVFKRWYRAYPRIFVKTIIKFNFSPYVHLPYTYKVVHPPSICSSFT